MERSPRSASTENATYDFAKGELEFAAPDPDIITTPTKTEALSNTGVEHLPEVPTSPTAALLRNATERLATFLDTRASTKEDRLAARAEKIDSLKDTLRTYGAAALNTAYEVSVTTASVTYLTVEAGLDAASTVRQKLTAFGSEAKMRIQKRLAYYEAHAMNTAYDQETARTAAYNRDHDEALAMNEQKKADQEAAFDSYTPNIEATQKREDQEAAYESYEDNIEYSEMLETARELNARAEEARLRKEERKAARQEKYGKLRDKGSELYLNARKGFKVYGRALLRGARRGLTRAGRAVKAGASAARQAWKQS